MSSGAGRSAPSHAALDHEAAERERPHPHRGSRRAPGGLGQRRRIERALVQRDERLGHRERQLRPRPEPDMRRDRLEHAQMRAAFKPQRVAAAPRERQRALRVGALDRQLVGRLRLEHHRRALDRHAEPAEAARAGVADREHAEVQARRRLDANHARRPLARTYAIASRSRGPAVLSTSTCSRASSTRISAGSSRRAREARIDASRTAWHARLKPRNSRPRRRRPPSW